MSRDWTKEELQKVSAAMVRMGHMSYEKFCKKLDSGEFCIDGKLPSVESNKLNGNDEASTRGNGKLRVPGKNSSK